MSKKFYITTAIPYVNAAPHIGFALELIQTDAVARYHRQKGDEVFFLTGTDENSLKNVLAAEKEGLTVQKFVDRNTKRFIELGKVLNISNNDFIQTTAKKHFIGCQKLWQATKSKDIYKKKYKGLYCVGCEQFYAEKELVDNKCPEHQTKLQVVEEENYFFRLSAYQDKLKKLIKSDEYQIMPASRKNEVLSFIEMGLEDFSISRSQARAKNWGVPVPGDQSQVMYVWYDALSNYITALDYDRNGKNFKKFWPADVHIIGKGIIRFHAVYWPVMLLSAGLPLPKKLFVHGYINIAGEKMSKSLGNVVDPFVLVEKYGSEVVRYYLLRYIHPVQDSDFSLEKLEAAYQADLANGLGNLVSRVAGLIEQNKVKIKQDKQDKQDKQFDQIIESFSFDQALKYIWDKIAALDSLITTTKPWELAKAGKKAELSKILNQAANGIFQISQLLKPFLPQTAEKIEKIFTTKQIKKGEPLFPRFEK
ncbi:MAG: methionine--tRNA ligase [Candidatus Buchananbacteria bacterium RIFCSPHIGHO2_01_FULL_39_14]|uniref:methionine--tRNA ligase n=2 Tax=Candidatus Buchananiibacteriota TaxID=1817903 RepID=A0A1G1YTD2_9BACT|nr:MAG: methionine--tRNA ligase [Candidatus Buchananbacteria bacterium RIFCSPHIGHO2_01_FULL_39_14]OGY49456.1 MAG: methionine--tRNA ligase [Candidatus Buchananbacteria bacterium RIFCSPHIGHO2_02_FULL_39_17]OGY55621.1 MAG: methionine--tRNA ligase [Candidatus Buchananbacteria bacterium RIFCSPLOWO2_01_FULL_40_23b]